jgi:2-oxoglutarate ferredoxin oxidoreductase subunit alpha
LSEGGIGNAAEPWIIPDISKIPPIEVTHPTATGEEFLPYKRDEETGGRPWAIPGTPGLEHRVGGLEKQDGTGGVSYDHDNHALMTKYRAEKITKLQAVIPDLEVEGEGDTLILGWGGTRGSILTAATVLKERGTNVATAHLHYINPFPKNLGEVLQGYKKVIMPEMNTGQLRMLLRSQFLVDIVGIQNLCGRSFFVEELVDEIEIRMKGESA